MSKETNKEKICTNCGELDNSNCACMRKLYIRVTFLCIIGMIAQINLILMNRLPLSLTITVAILIFVYWAFVHKIHKKSISKILRFLLLKKRETE